MNFRKTVEDKILFILFTYAKEGLGKYTSETAFDIIRKHGLRFEDFSDPVNQALYKSIQNQLLKGFSDVDFLRIIEYRPKEYKVFEQQASQYLMLINHVITNNYASFSELDSLIWKLKEFAIRDFLHYKAQQILATNFDNTDVVQFGLSLIVDYNEMYGRLTSGITAVVPNSAKNLKEDLLNKVMAKSQGKNIGVPIHLNAFAEHFGGWLAPDFTIIGARPSMGKTAFILSVAWESAKHEPCAFFTFEMSLRQLNNKIASNLTGIDYFKIERGLLNQQELDQILHTYDTIENSNLNILGIEFIEIESLVLEVRRLHRLGKLKFVVIDYLQLMKSSGKHESREKEVSHISRQLKLLCVELNITIIALSQLGRSCEDRVNKRPMLSDLRESGAIEQDADNVIFLYRDAYYYGKDISVPYETEFKTEAIVAKGRNVGVTTLMFFNDVKAATTRDLVISF